MRSEYKILGRTFQLNKEAVTENAAGDDDDEEDDDDGDNVSYVLLLTVDF
jgi:hypothetical protein